MKTKSLVTFKALVLAVCLMFSVAPNFANASPATVQCQPPSRGGEHAGGGRHTGGGSAAPVNGFTWVLIFGLGGYAAYMFMGLNKQTKLA